MRRFNHHYFVHIRTHLPRMLLVLFAAFSGAVLAAQDEGATASGGDEAWNVHGQATGIWQYYPSFPARYSGPNSLPAQGGEKESTSATLFLGHALWKGGEFYINPEAVQGFGIGNSLGLAGFSNGDANKIGDNDPYWNIARLFVRQTFGFGGPTEDIKNDANQLAETEDISRLTFTAGKFAATDLFDNNTYSHDPRTQFLNWSMMESAAWDYPSDARGYTDGIAAELNRERWALRYGVFLEPKTPSGTYLVHHGTGSVAQAAELEERYTVWQQPGKIRFLVFYNRDRGGYFSDAATAGGDVNAAIAAHRQYGTPKYGIAVNAEQALAEDLGAFTRISWNDGRTEDWMFAQIDESLSTGLSLEGARWGRTEDTLGVAVAVNGISRQQQRYLEAGGLGISVGDGGLSYGGEFIFETYYAWRPLEYVSLTPDYQFILNPGYNQVRGPVNIFTGRLHLEF